MPWQIIFNLLDHFISILTMLPKFPNPFSKFKIFEICAYNFLLFTTTLRYFKISFRKKWAVLSRESFAQNAWNINKSKFHPVHCDWILLALNGIYTLLRNRILALSNSCNSQTWKITASINQQNAVPALPKS